MSVKLSAHDQSNLFSRTLISRFEGLLANGDESFIPNENMLKTEGLPVASDSGGPLFIKNGDKYELAGLVSCNATLNSDLYPKDSPGRNIFGQQRQAIYATFVDVRYYKDWIENHMGPVKK